MCYCETVDPDIGGTCTDEGVGSFGNFSLSITSLDPNTTYFVRAYATNTAGTVYGSQVSFTTLPQSSMSGDSFGDDAQLNNIGHKIAVVIVFIFI